MSKKPWEFNRPVVPINPVKFLQKITYFLNPGDFPSDRPGKNWNKQGKNAKIKNINKKIFNKMTISVEDKCVPF